MRTNFLAPSSLMRDDPSSTFILIDPSVYSSSNFVVQASLTSLSTEAVTAVKP
jgi:hypothetical protein